MYACIMYACTVKCMYVADTVTNEAYIIVFGCEQSWEHAPQQWKQNSCLFANDKTLGEANQNWDKGC